MSPISVMAFNLIKKENQQQFKSHLFPILFFFFFFLFSPLPVYVNQNLKIPFYRRNESARRTTSSFAVRIEPASAGSAGTTSANFHWPPSPILPPIASRVAHLVPATSMPDEHHMNDYQRFGDLPPYHSTSSDRDTTSTTPNGNHKTGSWIHAAHQRTKMMN